MLGRTDKTGKSMRVLMVSSMRRGGNDYSYVRAFERAGASVAVVPPEQYIPPWSSTVLKATRRLLRPAMFNEFNATLRRTALHFRPHLLFVFKGETVDPASLREIRSNGTIAVNFFPDVGFLNHGPLLPKSLPEYDWVFTSKSFGLEDMRAALGITRASFLPHAFDPEIHKPTQADFDELQRYRCDASFIGVWSPKKERILASLLDRCPDLDLKIWGSPVWNTARSLRQQYQGHPVLAAEYAKAVGSSFVSICMLTGRQLGSSSGDRTTARTFEVPAMGGFMAHERTAEAQSFFRSDSECVYFENVDELADIIRHYIANPRKRNRIAAAGRERALSSGYSYDDRVATILKKVAELRG